MSVSFRSALALCVLVLGPMGCATDPRAPAASAGYEIASPRGGLIGFFDCLRTNAISLASAHRGGPGPGAPENSLAAMRATARVAPPVLEIDVRKTKDGVLVLLHDSTLDRTTTGAGNVADATLADLSSVKLKDKFGVVTGEKIPTLSEAIDWARGRAVLQLDIKRGTAFEDIAREIQAKGVEAETMLIAYSIADAIALHRAAPRAMLSVELKSLEDVGRLEQAAIPLGQVLAWTGTHSPDAALYGQLRARGIEVIFGTLGGADSWDARIAAKGDDRDYLIFAQMGVTLIASDRPREAFAALDAADGPGIAHRKCLD